MVFSVPSLCSVELIKLRLQVKSGLYFLEHLWERAPFFPLALCIMSLYPSNDFYSPALLLVFHHVQAFSFFSKDKPVFHFLFCLMCSPISLKWQGRFMEFEVWTLSASSSLSGNMTKTFIGGELMLVENNVNLSSWILYKLPNRCMEQTFIGIIYTFDLWPLHIWLNAKWVSLCFTPLPCLSLSMHSFLIPFRFV